MTTATTTTQHGGQPVTLRDVQRVFDTGVKAVDGVSLDIAAGDFVALLGPSGCGKSTLLRLIAGLDRPQGGEVVVGDHTVTPAGASRRGIESIAFVFQDAHLLPWRNVLRNVELPLELRGMAKNDRRDAARRMIEQVGLTDAIRRYPAQLSGGMRMRVSLARALITAPKILLLDEPFAALDEITRQRLDESLYALWRLTGVTVLFVTHSISEAVFLAQRVVMFSRRPAKVVRDERLDLPLDRPGELRTEPRFNAIARDLYRTLEQQEPPA